MTPSSTHPIIASLPAFRSRVDHVRAIAVSSAASRHAAFNLSLDTIWEDPRDNKRMVAWTRRAWTNLRMRSGGGVYLNFAGLGEENALLARAGYAGNYERLREVKRRYDPTSFLRGNINIAP